MIFDEWLVYTVASEGLLFNDGFDITVDKVNYYRLALRDDDFFYLRLIKMYLECQHRLMEILLKEI